MRRDKFRSEGATANGVRGVRPRVLLGAAVPFFEAIGTAFVLGREDLADDRVGRLFNVDEPENGKSWIAACIPLFDGDWTAMVIVWRSEGERWEWEYAVTSVPPGVCHADGTGLFNLWQCLIEILPKDVRSELTLIASGGAKGKRASLLGRGNADV
jgi:hypothetical protein